MEVLIKKPQTLEEKIKLVQEAISNHLYIKTWSLLSYLQYMRDCPAETENHDILLAYNEEQKPVAVSVCVKYPKIPQQKHTTHLMFYTHPSYRRMGIGKRLVDHWKQELDFKECYAQKGLDESVPFFQSVGLRIT